MRTIIRNALLIAILSLPMAAFGAHSVSLTWTASNDTGAAYNVYRLNAACPVTPPATAAALLSSGFVLANSAPVSATAFTDNEVSVGKFCYAATALLNGAESVPSNLAPAVILPAPPTALSVPSSN